MTKPQGNDPSPKYRWNPEHSEAERMAGIKHNLDVVALDRAYDRIGDMEWAIREALRQLESIGGIAGRKVDAAIEALRSVMPR